MALALSCAKEGSFVPETGREVPLPLAVSVSEGAPVTKMTGSVVQKESFRGIDYLVLAPFVTGGAPVQGSDAVHGPYIVLPGIESSFGEDAGGGDYHGLVYGSNARLYKWVYMREGTDACLVYGKAIDQMVATAGDDSLAFKKRNGRLRMTPIDEVETASDITFTPEPYLNAYKKYAQFDSWRNNLRGILNNLVKTNVSKTGASVRAWFDDPSTYNFHPAMEEAFHKFSNYGKVMSGGHEVLDIKLSELYAAVNTLRDKDLSLDYHDGTFYYVWELATDIYNKFQTYRNNGTMTISGTTVKLAAKNPDSFGIPYGAYALQYQEGSKQFEKILDNKDTGERDKIGIYMADERHFVYPPSLFYTANSPLSISADETVTEQYKSTTGDWASILSFYTESAVNLDSKAAAVTNPMQFGVSRLDLAIRKTSAASLSQNSSSNVAVDNDKFPLTGIVVAGQKAVDYAFNPIISGTETEYLVYDSDVYSGTSPRAYLSASRDSETISLLLLQSQEGKDVHFALEFLNDSGNTLYGTEGCEILKGTHFYLVGVLALPEGASRVFTQDRITTVNVSVSSFRNAYAILPDIRETQVTIGVDARMTWDMTEDPVIIQVP